MVLFKEPPLIEIKVQNIGSFKIPAGKPLVYLIDIINNEYNLQAILAKKNNQLIELQDTLDEACEIELIDINSDSGAKIFRRSANFLMYKACRELFPNRSLLVKHSLNNALYCEFLDSEITEKEIKQIDKKMMELVHKDYPIRKHYLSKAQALDIFFKQQDVDKIEALSSIDDENIVLHEMDNFYEYSYGAMLNRTGMINKFRLLKYAHGMLLQTPNKGVILNYVEQENLTNIFTEAKSWMKMLGILYVNALNRYIARNEMGDLIRVNEALHEKKIAYIADEIFWDSKKRLVLITGPSSSGKTTFAQRLMIQIRVNGGKPVSISLDNYFVDRELTPKDENGDYDFEALEAIKLERFNQDLVKLINGEEVEMPVFNFRTGKSEENGLKIRVPKNELIIIEGIHALNDRLTEAIPDEQKFKIYISPLTQVNIDYTNRMAITDCRLLRRMVRDNRTRGYNALDTIKRWPSVRRGEEKNIFPFHEKADIDFNSSLLYEYPILKKYAVPLLEEIDPEHKEYIVAKRLLDGLKYYHLADNEGDIPLNSILREFIGDSCFKH